MSPFSPSFLFFGLSFDRQVIQFCLSSELFKELDTIMVDSAKDGGMGEKEEEEFKLMSERATHNTAGASFELGGTRGDAEAPVCGVRFRVYSTRYTDKHKEFVDNFEQRLEAFIISKDCTIQEFYGQRTERTHRASDGSAHSRSIC